MNRSLTVALSPARIAVPVGLAVLLAVATVVAPAAPAGAQTADWVDIPVTVSLADGEYFAVVTSEDGTIEAQQQGTTRTFGYPEPAACDGRAGDCYTSDPDGAGSIGFEGDAAVVRAALRSLRFKVNDDVELSDATISVSTSGNPDPTRDLYYNPTNGHYYEYVTGNRSWFAARDAAEALRLELNGTGYEGYLATITSLSESRFIGDLIDVGVEPDGAMEIPEDVRTVGWYEPAPGAGVVPGEDGTAVLAGHVDSRVQGPGAFWALRDLVATDRVEVVHEDGSVSLWEVTEVIRYPKTEVPIEDIFVWSGPKRLALITCGGEFDRSIGSYLDNYVVMARPVAVGLLDAAPDTGLAGSPPGGADGT